MKITWVRERIESNFFKKDPQKGDPTPTGELAKNVKSHQHQTFSAGGLGWLGEGAKLDSQIDRYRITYI